MENNTPLIVGGALVGGLYLLSRNSNQDPLFGGAGASLSGGSGNEGVMDSNTPYIFNIFQEPATGIDTKKSQNTTTGSLADTYFSTNNLTSSTNRPVNIFERTTADDPDRFAYSSVSGIADRFYQQSVTMETAQARQNATKKSANSSGSSINYTSAPTPTISRPKPIFSVTPIRDSIKPPKLFSTLPVNSSSARTPTFNTNTTTATQSKKSSNSSGRKPSVITQSPFSFIRSVFK